jgi:serine protease Do
MEGALADYSQAISINPEYFKAYFNRAILKATKLNDRKGAIQDLRQAAQLFRETGQIQDLQKTLEALRDLGTIE